MLEDIKMANKTMKKPRASNKKGMAQAQAGAVKSKIGERKEEERKGESVELVFGINAGIIWDMLSQKGPMSAMELETAAALRTEEVYGALGWLGREDKINVEKQGMARIYSLKL